MIDRNFHHFASTFKVYLFFFSLVSFLFLSFLTIIESDTLFIYPVLVSWINPARRPALVLSRHRWAYGDRFLTEVDPKQRFADVDWMWRVTFVGRDVLIVRRGFGSGSLGSVRSSFEARCFSSSLVLLALLLLLLLFLL